MARKTAAPPGATPLVMALYGDSKVGKTWFSATAPNPVFLSVAPERGWSALPSHPNWKNTTVLTLPRMPGLEMINGNPEAPPLPKGYAVEKPTALVIDEMHKALDLVETEGPKRGWRTVVLDTFTQYASMVVSQLSDYGRRDMWGKGQNNQWNVLYEHVALIRNRLQNLPMSVIWVFHADDQYNGNVLVKRQPALTGKSYNKLLAPCMRLTGYIDRTVIEDEERGRVIDRRLYTEPSPHLPYMVDAGSNFEHLLPEGGVGYVPSWEALAKRLGSVVDMG